MIWQDVLLMVGGFGFSIALLPSVVKRVKIPWVTSFTTAFILTCYLLAYATLGLWLAFIAGAVTSGMWWYLLVVALRQ